MTRDKLGLFKIVARTPERGVSRHNIAWLHRTDSLELTIAMSQL